MTRTGRQHKIVPAAAFVVDLEGVTTGGDSRAIQKVAAVA
jgi:hypothetical protein